MAQLGLVRCSLLIVTLSQAQHRSFKFISGPAIIYSKSLKYLIQPQTLGRLVFSFLQSWVLIVGFLISASSSSICLLF